MLSFFLKFSHIFIWLTSCISILLTMKLHLLLLKFNFHEGEKKGVKAPVLGSVQGVCVWQFGNSNKKKRNFWTFLDAFSSLSQLFFSAEKRNIAHRGLTKNTRYNKQDKRISINQLRIWLLVSVECGESNSGLVWQKK